ncbi:unnamed protein product [Arctia plantaginis]|uniref:Uncharacterized protein n=1 Tax=Arctia plantaginis TaxID=874455 RepID=A0A8S0Z9K3_ARCPL|nr:unnamed protein product [Arctia plantaginis]
MKWLSMFLAISLTASEKLDRTYLPPPGAQFAGGNPNDILAPLEPPNLPQTGSIPVGYVPNSYKESKESLIKSPITTTSYAFTQTTTYPSIESYGTTAIPINPIIGLPVPNLDQNNNLFHNQNLPNYFQQDDAHSFNILPGSINQNQNQNIIGTEDDVLIPSSNFQQPIFNPGFQQYPSEQLDKETNSDLNVVHPHPITVQENLIPQNQYSEIQNQGVSTERVPLSNTYINTPLSPYNQNYPSYSNVGTSQKQFLPEVQSTLNPELLRETEFKQLGQDHRDVLSTTPSFISSVAPDSSSGSIRYFERPQAARDRGAVILNYENVLTPNSYSYSYDTSNGIHADESGVVEDGTKAKGSYSYTGDDGKIYSIFYTADENGFQPHGDHLPTPPPVPEAIKRVIEQAARDKEAGIVDDGSYDENKYGYKKYYNPLNHRRLQGNKLESQKLRPMSGATNNISNKKQPIPQFPEHVDIGNKNNSYKNGFENEKYEEDYNENRNNTFFALNNNEKTIDSPRSHDTSDFDADKSFISLVPGEHNDQSNIVNFKDPHPFGHSENKNIKLNQVNNSANKELPRSGQASASPKDSFSDITNIREDVKQNPVNNELIKAVDEKYDIHQQSNQEINQQVDQNGYYYNIPKNQEFTSRMKAENPSSTTERLYTTFKKITTPLPVTPKVRIEPTNRIQYNNTTYNSNRKSTTPRPFMTSRVTIPRGGSYSDYDNEDDQDIEGENVPNNIQPSEVINNGARRPLQSSQTVTPSYMSDTAIPTASYSSRFGNTETPQTNSKTQEAQKLTSKTPESLNDFGNTKTSNYMYQTTRPSFDIDTTVTPNYSSHVEVKVGAYNPSVSREYGPREHLTSTFKPVPTTTIQTPSVYQPDFYRPPQLSPSSNGFQYQPISSEYNVRPQIPVKIDAGSNPDYYQTINYQKPVDYSGTTNGPEIRYDITSPKYASTTVFSPHSQGSLISSGLSEPHVSDTPFSGYIYGPPKIVYPSTDSSRTIPDSIIHSQPSQPNRFPQLFSTTTQPPTRSSVQDTYDQNTVVDGFGRPIISEIQSVSSPDQKNNPFIGTQFSPEEDLKRVDGTSVGSSALAEGEHPTYTVEHSTRYPEYNNQAKVIGENFSGPKQPHKFDPQTGYHYK